MKQTKPQGETTPTHGLGDSKKLPSDHERSGTESVVSTNRKGANLDKNGAPLHHIPVIHNQPLKKVPSLEFENHWKNWAVCLHLVAK